MIDSPEDKLPLDETAGIPLAREEKLEQLLGTDYDYALENGLLDRFYYNPETGEDALLHILQGSVVRNNEGGLVAEGYHHERSAAHPDTYVDRDHLENANSDKRKSYRENIFEPYFTLSVVEGYKKANKSTMFPKEYDALAVIKTILQAADRREKSADEVADNGFIVTEGQALLVDDQSVMDLRIILDPTGEKIVTAYPIKVKKNVLNIGRRPINENDKTPIDMDAVHRYLGL